MMIIYGWKQAIGFLSLLISFTLLTYTFSTANAARDFDSSLNQKLKQHNLCAQDSACSNSGLNIAEMVNGLKQKIYTKVSQKLEQHNLCVDSECLNEGYNQLLFNKLKGKFNQKIEQINECDNSECINEGVNEFTGNGNTNSQQTIVQSNTCASGATCINSAGDIYFIGNTQKTG
jgi:hypothetical protein